MDFFWWLPPGKSRVSSHPCTVTVLVSWEHCYCILQYSMNTYSQALYFCDGFLSLSICLFSSDSSWFKLCQVSYDYNFLCLLLNWICIDDHFLTFALNLRISATARWVSCRQQQIVGFTFKNKIVQSVSFNWRIKTVCSQGCS